MKCGVLLNRAVAAAFAAKIENGRTYGTTRILEDIQQRDSVSLQLTVLNICSSSTSGEMMRKFLSRQITGAVARAAIWFCSEAQDNWAQQIEDCLPACGVQL